MGGTLTVTSEGRDRGSCFTFTIPLHERSVRSSVPRSSVEASMPDTRCSAVPNGGARPPPLRVLVAEDDGLCAALMRKILVRLQVDGTLVSDGAAAVAAYQQGVCAKAGASDADVA